MTIRTFIGLLGALSTFAAACDDAPLPGEACHAAFDRFEECGLDISSDARQRTCVEDVEATEDGGGACDAAMAARFLCFANLSCTALDDGQPDCQAENLTLFEVCEDPFEI